MSISPAFLDELRARTRVSEVIGNDVRLIKAGKEYKACCPFHDEKTPSFTVNDQKSFYHCFGCGAHGDAIRYLTDARGLAFIDAVKELAGKAGMEMPAPDPKARERAQKRAELVDVTEAAADFYRDQLGGIEGSAARAYVERRGLSAQLVTRFGLGFAPDSRGRLKRALDRFDEKMLVESGMLIQPDDGRESYDRFRGRLMIPIRDPRGRTIAFGGRIIGEGEPKYLNSPETPLFDKGRMLYNLDLAGPASRKSGRLIVVEGYMDVIGLAKGGIDDVVAPNGTALTEDQMRLLWRLDDSPLLCFDGDAAGAKAAVKAAIRALPLLSPRQTLRFVALPDGKDPDDIIAAQGRQAFEEILDTATSLVERLWTHERDAQPLDTPEARAGLKQRLIDHSRSIEDKSLAQLYREDWLARFDKALGRDRGYASGRGSGGSFGGSRGGSRGGWKKKDGRWVPPEPPVGQQARALSTQGLDGPMLAAILHGFARHPAAISEEAETLAALELADPKLGALRDELLDLAFSAESLEQGAALPIWDKHAGGTSLPPGMSFAFNRAGDEHAARQDLHRALGAVAAAAEIETALSEAQRRLEEDLSEAAYEEQQRLRRAAEDVKNKLADLASGD